MRHDEHSPVEDHLRQLLRAVVDGSYSVEEAALLLRAEIIASFMRGYESNVKRASDEETREETTVF